jgi:hypothetical protein
VTGAVEMQVQQDDDASISARSIALTRFLFTCGGDRDAGRRTNQSKEKEEEMLVSMPSVIKPYPHSLGGIG